MTCPAWQQMLDEAPHDAEALDAHALGCPACLACLAEQRLFLRALPLSPPSPPAGFARRVCAALLADRPSRPVLRRLAPWAGLLAAAGLLLAVGLRSVPPPAAVPVPAPQAAQQDDPDLRGSVARATTAVADAASSTVQQAARFLPPMGVLEQGPLPEPALEPLVDAAGEVQAGLAPVADSARRAVNLFLRDLPMGRNPG